MHDMAGRPAHERVGDAVQALPIATLKVMVVDDQSQMRQIIQNSLQRLGIDDVVVAGSAQEALRLMKGGPAVDLVLCDYYLGMDTDGQQLLDAARGADMLSPATPWVFVSASAIRSDVMTAGDSAPDAYIVKPFSDQALRSCIRSVCARKRALAPLLVAVHSKDWEAVLAVADTYAARMDALCVEGIKRKAQALMKLGRFEEAAEACTCALQMNSELAWASLGHAQALRAMGKDDAARLAVEQLITRQPDYAAAYDTLIDMVEEQGDQRAALATALVLAERVPNAKRKFKLGSVALRAGQIDVAVAALDQAVSKNRYAVTKSPDEGILLAQALADSSDPARALAVAAEVSEQFPRHACAQTLCKAVRAQGLQRTGRADEAAAMMADIEFALSTQTFDDHSKLMIAKAALITGHTELGQVLMESVARSNSDKPSMLAATLRIAQGTSIEDSCKNLVDRAGGQVEQALQDIRQAKRNGDFALAISIAESVLNLSPTHFTVLIELCTLHLVAITRDTNALEHAERAHDLLDLLESSHPNHDRVAAARRFYRERMVAVRESH